MAPRSRASRLVAGTAGHATRHHQRQLLRPGVDQSGVPNLRSPDSTRHEHNVTTHGSLGQHPMETITSTHAPAVSPVPRAHLRTKILQHRTPAIQAATASKRAAFTRRGRSRRQPPSGSIRSPRAHPPSRGHSTSRTFFAAN